MIAGRFANEEYGAQSNGSARPPFVANTGAAPGRLSKQLRYPVHDGLVPVGFEEMPAAQRSPGDLRARMPGEGLHPLGRKPGLDPARNREMPERMPIGYPEQLVPAMLYHLFSSTTNTRFTLSRHKVIGLCILRHRHQEWLKFPRVD
jgi:hypothetical protein